MILVSVCLTVLANGVEPPPVDVRSEDGSHHAVVRLLEGETRPSRNGLFELTVYEDRGTRGEKPLWTALVESPDPAWLHLITDDGRSFVRLDPRTGGSERIVVWSRGRRLAHFDAEDLGFGPNAITEASDWLVPSAGTLRLRPQEPDQPRAGWLLDLVAVDGGLRTIDLMDGTLTLSIDSGASAPTRVVPTVPPELNIKLETVYVRSWSVPEEVVAGTQFELRVRGAFPTPGWRIIGYGMTVEPPEDGGLDRIVITPWAAQPTSGGFAQIITHFDTRATVILGDAGRYLLEVRGRDPKQTPPGRELLVRPGALLVSLGVGGGFAGTQREVVLLRDGRLRGPRGTRLVPLDPFFDFVNRLGTLPPESIQRYAPGGADFLRYELVWVDDGAAYTASLDETTLIEPYRGVADALMTLADPARGPSGPPTYRLDPTASTFRIETGSSGLLGALGHKHTFSASDFEGTVVVDPAQPAEGTLEIAVRARDLALVGQEDDGDRAEIEREMRENVLEVEKYPTISFQTTDVSVKHLGEQRWEAILVGQLLLHGQVRRVNIRAVLDFADDVLRARGKLKLRMSKYGIEPPTAAAGTIRVADEVELRFDFVARRE